ncbi:hypothetical protein [Caballeronia sp. GAFFF3]|uniref:hypothetical protein n=1 Tax=Caballeronia sp. GAFFF3 TaxID=2921759 RepID=UPI0020277CE7|nr:hypothetical protein [Caballeronia sp. GAFFF3]
MAKAKIVRDSEGRFYGIKWICPGCDADTRGSGVHILPVNWLPSGETLESPHNAGKPHWSFNGDLDRPIFGPSVLSRWDEWQGEGVPAKPHVCHSFVGCNGAVPGQIVFLGDCTHSLANQTVDLPEVEA